MWGYKCGVVGYFVCGDRGGIVGYCVRGDKCVDSGYCGRETVVEFQEILCGETGVEM